MSSQRFDWVPDVMPGFESAPLGDAVLVRPVTRAASPRAAVLLVHGYNDYFFHAHVADALAVAGFASYALDLPGAGRAIASRPLPHFFTDVAQPAEHLTTACAAVEALEGGAPVIVHAHSTGGLVAAVWALRPPESVIGVALDAPLFGLADATAHRPHVRAAVGVLARLAPRTVVSRHPSVYAGALHTSGGGEWNFDTAWKRPRGLPVRAGWLASVLRAQRKLASGAALPIPTLIATSDSSGPDRPSNPRLRSQDTVVDVHRVAKLADTLGPLVTTLQVPGAVHDLTLASPEPRAAYLEALVEWMGRLK